MIQIAAATPAELLKGTRGAAGLTTREIGAKVGVSASTVSAWERGAGEPSATQFILWARATKQPLDQMIEGLSSCTPWDSNPEPTDYESIAATFWELVGPLVVTCQVTPDAREAATR